MAKLNMDSVVENLTCCVFAGKGLVLLWVKAAGSSPWPDLHLRSGEHGALHLHDWPQDHELSIEGIVLLF